MRMCWRPRSRAEKSQSQPKTDTPLPRDTPTPRDCKTFDATRLSTPRHGPTHTYARWQQFAKTDLSACCQTNTPDILETRQRARMTLWSSKQWQLTAKMYLMNKTGMWPHLITWQAVATAEDTEVTTFSSRNLSVLVREALGGLKAICLFVFFF